MRIGIHANLSKPAAAVTLNGLARTARELGVKLVACEAEVARLAPGAETVPPERFGKTISLLLALGGDGTVLQAVRALGGARAPILGINLGHLGFLTSVPDTRAEEALRALAAKRYTVAEYPLLEARLHRGDNRRRAPFASALALNDIVMGWGTSPRATMIEVDVDGRRVVSYFCDGLIVATPVGSTGHALSAGGPILHRETPALVLTPICPHTLSNRPVVLPDTRRVTLRIGGQGKRLLLSVDGRELGWLEPGDRLDIHKTARPARFVHLADYSWFDLLTRKLHWRGSSADPK